MTAQPCYTCTPADATNSVPALTQPREAFAYLVIAAGQTGELRTWVCGFVQHRTMHHAPCTMHHAPCTMHHAPCTSCKRQKRSLKMHFLPAHTPTLHLHGVGWVSAVVEQSLCRHGRQQGAYRAVLLLQKLHFRHPWRSDVLAASLRNYSRHSFTPQQKNHTSKIGRASCR